MRSPAQIQALITKSLHGEPLTEEERGDARASVLENFPEATWMPWEDPPVGVVVGKLSARGVLQKIGVIEGRFGAMVVPHPECPSCACPRQPTGAFGWWRVRSAEKVAIAGGPPEHVTYLEYPPGLVPIDD